MRNHESQSRNSVKELRGVEELKISFKFQEVKEPGYLRNTRNTGNTGSPGTLEHHRPQI